MAARTAKYPPGVIMDLGKGIYDRVIKPTLESSNLGKLVAIDVDTDVFEIGESSMEATRKLLDRQPDAWVAVLRIGGGPVHRIGIVPGQRRL